MHAVSSVPYSKYSLLVTHYGPKCECIDVYQVKNLIFVLSPSSVLRTTMHQFFSAIMNSGQTRHGLRSTWSNNVTGWYDAAHTHVRTEVERRRCPSVYVYPILYVLTHAHSERSEASLVKFGTHADVDAPWSGFWIQDV